MLNQINMSFNTDDNEVTADIGAGGDFETPLSGIHAIISEFSLNKYDNIPTIMVNALASEYNLGGKKIYLSDTFGVKKCSGISVGDSMNATNLLDGFKSVVSVDIDHLFTLFFEKLHSINQNNFHDKNLDTLDYLAKQLELMNDTHAIDQILLPYVTVLEDQITASAALTFLCYSGKNLGSKGTILDWCHKVFMKDLLKTLDPNTILYSETGPLDGEVGTIGYGKAVEIDNKKAYQSIQLGYNNWSFVIDQIFTLSADSDRLTDAKFRFVQAARRVFCVLQELSTTTTNSVYGISGDGSRFSNNKFIELAARQIHLPKTRAYLKGLNRENFRNYFADNNNFPEIDTILKKKLVSISVASNVFVKLAYLSLLEFAVANFRSVTNEVDFTTGDSSRNLLLSKRADILGDIARIVRRNYDKWNMAELINRGKVSRKKDELSKLTAKTNHETVLNYGDDYDNGRYSYSYILHDNSSERNQKEANIRMYEMGRFFRIWPISTCDTISTILYMQKIFEEEFSPSERSNSSDTNTLENELNHLSDTRITHILTREEIRQNKYPALVSLESLETLMETLEDGIGLGMNANYDQFQTMNNGILRVTNESDIEPIPAPEPPDVQVAEEQVGEGDGETLGYTEEESSESYQERAEHLQKKYVDMLIERYT
jgi:hypothetical protein